MTRRLDALMEATSPDEQEPDEEISAVPDESRHEAIAQTFTSRELLRALKTRLGYRMARGSSMPLAQQEDGEDRKKPSGTWS
jgi:hypothetical protein